MKKNQGKNCFLGKMFAEFTYNYSVTGSCWN
jgi:hypothetical protein